jgi:heme/copper-type cytochrome/quinol oxidase subunit 2
MKKILLFLISIAILISSFIFSSDALAELTKPANTRQEAVNLNPIGIESPIQSVTQATSIFVTIVQWIYTIFYIVAVLFILIAAYNFLLGGSDESKIKTAKAQLKYAVIAIVIALISTGVAKIIDNFLTTQGRR